MPRRNRAKRDEPRPAPGGGFQRSESAPDGEWHVRSMTGSAKFYRCPGCDHEIRPGTPHVVAWPADHGDIEDRRHWHRTCWEARLRRRPTSRRW